MFAVIKENNYFYFGIDMPYKDKNDLLEYLKTMEHSTRNDYCRLIHKINPIEVYNEGKENEFTEPLRNVCSSFSSYPLSFDINNTEIIDKWGLDVRTYADYNVKDFIYFNK